MAICYDVKGCCGIFFFEDLRLIITYDFEDLSVFITYDFEDLSLTIVLNVVAAGSLLEFAIAEVADIPVGRVRNIFVYPFSFAEFVSALGGEIILDHARNSLRGSVQSESAHEKLLEYLKVFLIVGGMPAAVRAYVETRSFLAARDEQRDTMQNLKEDFA